jgi:pilus assembly protein CpaB
MDRQKIIMIFGAAWVSAALLTWFVFSRATNAKTEELVQVVAAAQDLPAGTRVKKSDLKRVSISKKDAPKFAVMDESVLLDRVLLHPVSAGESVVTTKVTGLSAVEGVPAMIQQGMRAISVPITDVTSAGGLIGPRSRVDVLFTRTGTMKEALTSTILQDIQVIAVGKLTEIGQQVDPKTAQQSQTRAATLMVTPEQAAKVELAKNQGKVSLVLRNPMDRSTLETSSATAEALDPQIFEGAARAIRAGMKVPAGSVRDDKAWAQLTGAAPGEPGAAPQVKVEPPKPKIVIDVYRGDKHVQEIFQ